MTLVKDTVDGMAYEPVKRSTKVNGKQQAIKIAGQVSTSSLVWMLVKRHKVGILAMGNIVLALNVVYPPWTDFVLGLVGK